ncbi:phosphatidylinositol glycan class C [Clonorchis sinensis]|uniref:Phosphatidylinositol glycan class C n=1 Tax=Clonorchis sinensis TaxID=79923 RepID=G7Y369_CLOSI|nr:phosphatidylinositol glycan class C [Clonorchis sinensis]
MPASTVLMFFVTTGYLLFWFFGTSEQVNLQRALFHIRTGLVIFTFSLILAPILHSLLATVSTDSIYAMAGLFFLVNWACTDYTTQLADYAYEPGSNTTAFSSSLLAALCLASRLPTPYHTFVLIAAGTVLFALWPSLVQVIRVRAGKAGQLCLTLFAFLFSNTFLWPIVYHEAPMEYKVLISIANLTLIVLINFIGPWVLVRMQRIKRNIHGPWDEAVVQQS